MNTKPTPSLASVDSYHTCRQFKTEAGRSQYGQLSSVICLAGRNFAAVTSRLSTAWSSNSCGYPLNFPCLREDGKSPSGSSLLKMPESNAPTAVRFIASIITQGARPPRRGRLTANFRAHAEVRRGLLAGFKVQRNHEGTLDYRVTQASCLWRLGWTRSTLGKCPFGNPPQFL